MGLFEASRQFLIGAIALGVGVIAACRGEGAVDAGYRAWDAAADSGARGGDDAATDGGTGAGADAGIPLDGGATGFLLSRVTSSQITARFDNAEAARIARSCDVYCQARGPDGGCDAGATIDAGLSLTIARPEIVLGAGERDGGPTIDRGVLVYVLREVREPGSPVIWSPACQQRQQRFAFDRSGPSLAFNSDAAPFDVPFDFLPELPDASVARDFCSTRDTRLSEAVDGGLFATTQITIGNVSDAGNCSLDGDLSDVVVFASFSLAGDPFDDATNAGDEFRSPDGPGGDTALYCGALIRSADDIPTAIIGGDRVAALFCSNLLDTAGIAPRFYSVVRSAPDGGVLRIYRITVYEPDAGGEVPPAWIRTGGKQGSLVDARVPERAVGAFIYAAASKDAGDVSRLAWFQFDFDADAGGGSFVRDGGAVVGGYLPRPMGLSHIVEKYALGASRDGAGNYFIAYLTEDASEYCSVEQTSQTTCFKDDTGHLRIRVVDTALSRVLADVSVARGDVASSVDPIRLLMAPTHPDIVVRDGFVFLAHGYSHYPISGCGDAGMQPCRGKSDIVTLTSVLDVWQVDGG